jgi:trk/ktr system potassium uptake protein
LTANGSNLLQRFSPTVERMRTWANVSACLGLLAMCAEHGFASPLAPLGILHGLQWLAIAAYLARFARRFDGSHTVFQTLTSRWIDVCFLAVMYALLMVIDQPASALRVVGVVFAGVMRGLGLSRRVLGIAEDRMHRGQRPIRPDKIMVVSFVTVIAIGAGLLLLPAATTEQLRDMRSEHPILHAINCVFTSTSATCVTGLVVYDTGTDFSRFGQFVICGLIQVGGLGIMILGSIFGLLTGRHLTLRESLVLQDVGSHETIGQVRSMVRFIVVTTILFELVGAAVLYGMWPDAMTTGDRVFYSVFHAISAFCNAGFSLQSDSLITYGGAWGVYTAIMPLIVIGGLGFPVLHNLSKWLVERLRRRNAHGQTRPGKIRLNLHTKVVLTSTIVLIVVPAVLIFLFESAGGRTGDAGPDAMVNMSAGSRSLAALFQSVTTRTAGFNTTDLDVESVSPASAFLMCILMFIGGSPGSTAGGVKTAAIVVLGLSVLTTLRRRHNVEAFHRTIPSVTVQRAAVVVIVMMGVVSLVTMALCVTESGSLEELLFEAVSACGTVGLSMGVTEGLTTPGKVVIMLAMLAGRLGPLSMLIALAGREVRGRYDYPSEQVVIG